MGLTSGATDEEERRVGLPEGEEIVVAVAARAGVDRAEGVPVGAGAAIRLGSAKMTSKNNNPTMISHRFRELIMLTSSDAIGSSHRCVRCQRLARSKQNGLPVMLHPVFSWNTRHSHEQSLG